MICANKGYDLGFGKNRAKTANRNVILPVQRNRSHFLQVYLQSPRHNFQEAACSGCALVIHHKVKDISIRIDLNNLAVLSANIDNCPGLGKKVIRPLGMTSDFCYDLIGKWHLNTPIAGSNNIINILFC